MHPSLFIELLFFPLRLSTETERLTQLNSDITHQLENLESQRTQLKKEVKELKFRETRNLADCSELEDENIQLQKQVLTVSNKTFNFRSKNMSVYI